MENFKRPNKSSIIRVIISRFNDKGIQEFKVLYNKQGGVDTFTCLTDYNEKKEIIFKSVTPRRREYSDTFPNQSISSDDKSVEITKIVNGKETRRYRITISLNPNNEKEVELKVSDLLKNNSEKRKAESSTKRLLLDKDLMERYGQIAQCKKDEIDSQKIYKIKRFLDYRSNMLIYFQFINDFLVKGTDKEEIWRFVDRKNHVINSEFIEGISSNILENYITQEITDHNLRADKINEKNSDKPFKDKIHKFSLLDKDKFKGDIEKILFLFADFRHHLMHYNYTYFENLFEEKKIEIEIGKKNEELSEVLNLSFFEELQKIPKLREENKKNYLDDDTTLRVLGKEKKAETIYNAYNLLCNRKNGFNKFINSIFTNDGIEDSDFKELIIEGFNKRLDFLRNSIETGKMRDKVIEQKTLKKMKEELNEKNKIIKLIGTPYIWDIHTCKEYKELYNQRKNKIAEQSKLISVGKNDTNKKRITDLNSELLAIKNKMEEITKLNAKMRLEAKLQVAFGFLYVNYSVITLKNEKNKETKKYEQKKYRSININGFLNNFDTSKLREITTFLENRELYLQVPRDCFEDKIPMDFNLKSFEQIPAIEEGFLSNNIENNLSKFYVLMYLLIPLELRGDFLGFVKNHYYDIKNIDFVEIKEKETDKGYDKFFHNLRLFEKNSKKFEIIKYRIVDFKDLEDRLSDIYVKFGIDPTTIEFVENSGNKDTKLFDKNILLPLMKYYQYIFKLLNDIEIHALFRYGSEIAPRFNLGMKLNLSETIKEIKGLVIEDGEEKKKGKGDLNFSELMVINQLNIPASDFYKEKFIIYKEIVSKESGRVLTNQLAKEEINLFKTLYKLRNKIAHLNYKELFLDLLFEENININKELEEILMAVKKINLNDNKILRITFINDFYMKKEQFIFNQRQVNLGNISNPKSQNRELIEKDFLLTHNIRFTGKSSVDKILNRYKNLVSIANKEILNKNILKDVKELKIIYFTEELKNNKPNLVKNETAIGDLSEFELMGLLESIKGKLYKDSSDLLGIYKKYVVRDIKQKLIALFTKGENRYLTLELYDKTQYNIDLKILGKEAVTSKNKNNEYKKTEAFTFKENSSLSWDESNFKPVYELQNDLPINCDYRDSVFTYISPYQMRNSEKLKKHIKIQKRDILNGVVITEYTKFNETEEKEEYLGIYNQKIKALY